MFANALTKHTHTQNYQVPAGQIKLRGRPDVSPGPQFGDPCPIMRNHIVEESLFCGLILVPPNPPLSNGASPFAQLSNLVFVSPTAVVFS